MRVSRDTAFCQELFIELNGNHFFVFVDSVDKHRRANTITPTQITDQSRQVIQTTKSNVLLHTDIPDLELHASGKVRDIYKVDSNHLLFVATDRISAFDYVLATGIPEKGRVLTQLSLFWFDFLKDIVPNHLATADIAQYPAELQKYRDQLGGRSMLVVSANMVTIECVVRGYISGSGWKEYKGSGSVCGIKLPAGFYR